MLFLAVSFILGTPAWLGLTSLQVEDHRQAEALSLMQTAQGLGVVIGLGSVAAAGYLLGQWHKVVVKHDIHIPNAVKTLDAVPINVWLYVCVAVFAICLIGTLLWVREPEHPDSAEEEASSGRQPIDLSGV